MADQVGGSPAYPSDDFGGSKKRLDVQYNAMLEKADQEGWDKKWIHDWYRKELNATPSARTSGDDSGGGTLLTRNK